MTDEIMSRVSSFVMPQIENLSGKFVENQEFMSGMVDKIVQQMANLCDELKNLRRENNLLRGSLNNVNKKIKLLENEVHRQELIINGYSKEALSKNAIIGGLPRTSNENTEDLVRQTLKVLKFDLPLDAIKSCSRIKSDPISRYSPIKVTFRDSSTQNQVILAKKNHGKILASQISPSLKTASGSVSVRCDLTPFASKLLHELRKLQGRDNVAFVWPGIYGDILVKKTQSSKPLIIRSREDYSKFIAMTQ